MMTGLAAAALMLCSSCSTPPAADDGLVGIIYHAATRHDQGSVIERRPAPPALETEHVVAPFWEPPSYRISPGDVLAVSYFSQPSRNVEEYLVGNHDVLTLSIAGHDTHTADVTVRPDGCISFFLIGELRVRGLTIAQVRAEIASRVIKIMPGAEVTVMLKEGNSLAREFLNTLRSNTDLGSTRIMQVRHDGTVTFPLIGEVAAMGKTLVGLSQDVEARYDGVFNEGISVTLNLNTSSDGNIAVLGEVRNPGRYTIVNPVSPFFALAMAGGATDTAKKTQIVVVKRRAGGNPSWHIVNLDVNSSAPLGPEIALAPQDMLLVPKSGIANLNLFVDQYIRQMTPRTGLGFNYSLNP